MSRHDDHSGQVIPAHLDLLSIYSPALGLTEKNEKDQILFYYSDSQVADSKSPRPDDEPFRNQEDQDNEQLRQVGLAQGIVTFAKTFSNGENVESVETEKHRIVLTEIEEGWWILASIKYTSIPTSEPSSSRATPSSNEAFVEYSSRDVSPPDLLIKQIHRAYRIFLLHHGPSFSDVFLRMTREKFGNLLEHYWKGFAGSWDIFLHGNPTAEIYGGVKLAGGGELGTGVGEEQYGSGERDFMEGLIGRTDGLVDLTVSRFDGEQDTVGSEIAAPPKHQQPTKALPIMPLWLGTGRLPKWSDGMIFTGMGALSRPSLEAIWYWNQDIFLLGMNGYGIRESPSSRQRRQRRLNSQTDNTESEGGDESGSAHRPAKSPSKPQPPHQSSASRPNIPPPIVAAFKGSSDVRVGSDQHSPAPEVASKDNSDGAPGAGDYGSRPWMRYLTMGYNPSWPNLPKGYSSKSGYATIQGRFGETQSRSKELSSEEQDGSLDTGTRDHHSYRVKKSQQSNGRFLIGLMDDLQNDAMLTPAATNDPQSNSWSSRLSIRTLRVRLNKTKTAGLSSKLEESEEGTDQGVGRSKKWVDARLRVVIYVNNPFIFTFVFDPTASSLSLPAFYRNLHASLQALHQPLMESTSPAKAIQRLSSIHSSPSNPPQQIYSLTYDPSTLTSHTTIPNIPDPHLPSSLNLQSPKRGSSPQNQTWNRTEALATHNHILSTFTTTRRRPGDLERTAKTGRGWWITWLRVPPDSDANAAREDEADDDGAARSDDAGGCREALLVRRGSQEASGSSRSGSWGGAVARSLSLGMGMGTAGVEARTEGAGGVARMAMDGVGMDARKLVEGLFGLSR